jgi:taurine dioxygenase
MKTEKSTYEHIAVAPVTGALGAEIGSVDLSQPLSDGALSEIRRAFVENLVIFFRDQDITPEQHKAFARQFGDLHVNDFFPRVEGHDDVQLIVKEPSDTKNVGGVWHSDVTYTKRPALGSLLYAKEVPPYGGDTLFANMYLAYETLSDGMRAMLRGLRAEHSAAENFARRAADARDSAAGFRYSEKAEQDATHPAIRTHPESGRDALYVNRSFTKSFAGMTREESAPLLNFLFDHLSRPEFTCRLRWQAGTLAFWDNRCAQHFALNDYHGYRRHMNRVTVLGDEPFLAERAVADAA